MVAWVCLLAVGFCPVGLCPVGFCPSGLLSVPYGIRSVMEYRLHEHDEIKMKITKNPEFYKTPVALMFTV